MKFENNGKHYILVPQSVKYEEPNCNECVFKDNKPKKCNVPEKYNTICHSLLNLNKVWKEDLNAESEFQQAYE